MSKRKPVKDDFDVIMKKCRADIAAGRLINFQLFLLLKWLKDEHQLDNLDSLLVGIEILKSLPSILTKDDVGKYLLQAKTAYSEPKPKPDEHQ